MDTTEKLYHLALLQVPGVGGATVKQLLSYCGSAQGVFQASRAQLNKIPGIGPKTVASLMQPPALEAAKRDLATAERNQVSHLFMGQEDFPALLHDIPDSPHLLYTKGQPLLAAPRPLAIVGTRRATNYGVDFVRDLLAGLQPYRPVIVSGLAYGIDAAAHKQALAQGLPTVGVMANGLDRIYPNEHRHLAEDMVRTEGSGLITEHAFGTPADARLFPARNRIIAGLSTATVVVEAAAKGGALITAGVAWGYNREVFAVPGDVHRTYSRGCNDLIRRNKAAILTSPEDLVDYLGWDSQEQKQHQAEQATLWAEELPPAQAAVVKALQESAEPLHIDQLAWQVGAAIGELAAPLLDLELQGKIRALPGKRFVLRAPTR